MAEELFRRYPDVSEGRLARLKSHVISRDACAGVARDAGLDRLLVARALELGVERADELAQQPRVLGALTEAVLGAAHLALGWERTRAACIEAFAARLEWVASAPVEPKTLLQEEAQRLGRPLQYVAVQETGPAHALTFTYAVLVDGVELGRGTGRSKKRAQAEAALAAYTALVDGAGPTCT